MRTRSIAAALLLAVAGCTSLEGVPPGVVITCGTTADCPSGRVCHANRCLLPSDIGAPPDLVDGRVDSLPARGAAGTEFTLTLTATRPLQGAPRVILGLDPLVEPPCVRAAGNAYTCTYTATGAENRGKGGRVALDVRMTDLAGNETARNGVGALELDFAPPELAASTAEPALVPLGGVIQVFFTASEDLGQPPVLVASRALDDPRGTRFGLTPQPNTRNYQFTHLVTAADLAGAVDFSAELVDAVGNSTTTPAFGRVVIDNVPPVISALDVAPARVDPSGVVTVTLTASEAGALSVTIGGRTAACVEDPLAPLRFECARRMIGDEIAPGTEVSQPVVAVLTDAAGNPTSRLSSTVFDFKPPEITWSDVSPAAVRLGGALQVFFTMSEALGPAPVLVASRPLDEGAGAQTRFTLAPQPGTMNYLFTHLVTAADAPGPISFSVEATDWAGNVASPALAVGSATIDNVSPTMSLLDVQPGRIDATGVVTVSFTTSEAGTLSVTVGGRPMACAEGPLPLHFTCTRPMAGDEIPAGTEASQPVLATLVDAAGNTASRLSDVVFDFRPPEVTWADVSPASVRLGGVLQVLFTMSEALGPPPVLVASRALDEGGGPQTRFTPVQQPGTTNYLFTHLVTTADAAGPVAFSVEATDAAGNPANPALPVGSATIDNVPPVVSALQVVPARVDPTGVVTATFTVSEAVTPSVNVGGRPMACAPDAGSPLAFTCRRPMLGTELPAGAEASQTVVVELADAAGNPQAATASVVFDFRPPEVTWADVSPPAARLGGVLQVLFTMSEALGPAPVLVASRPLDEGGQPQTRFMPAQQPGTTNYLFTHLVTTLDAEGAVSFSVEATDVAGNVATPPLAVGAATIDNVPPTISALQLVPARIDPTGVVTVSFTTSEAGALTATLGGRPMACVASGADPLAFSCTWTMLGDELPAGTEEAQTVVIGLTDDAGNGDAASGTVVFDFRPPLVAAATVVYGAPDASVIPTVARASAGTRITVTVLADEALDPAVTPGLTARLGADALTFTYLPAGSTATSAMFDAVVPLGLPDGDYVVTVAWADVAGNTAATGAGLPPVHLRTTPPILEVDQQALVFVRSPLGNAADEDLGGYQIPRGAYFAVEPSDALTTSPFLPQGALLLAGGVVPSAVVVLASSDPDSLQLGVLTHDQYGRFYRKKLVSPDLAGVWLAGVDDAGNRSAPVKLTTSEWVATPNAPSLGSSVHALSVTPHAGALRAEARAVPSAERALASGTDAEAVATVAAGLWRKVGWDGVRPSDRREHAMAYDSARGRVVLFGAGDAEDTWEWDGVTWAQVQLAGPQARVGHAMAFDAARGRTVLFGGEFNSSFLGDTWEWDGARWIQVASAGPGARSGAAMANDSQRGQLVLFGGCTADIPCVAPETWAWDGTVWTTLAVAGPSSRYQHAMAYDRARDRVILFGGCEYGYEGFCGLGDTWEWDGTMWTSVATTGPSPRRQAAMFYDEVRGRVLLHGGEEGGALTQDTWEWDGSAWSLVTSAGPPPRSAHGVAYDSARRRAVIFGGNGGPTSVTGDTWEWDGVGWAEVALPGPGPRAGHALAADTTRGRVLFYGGSSYSQFAPEAENADTWQWDGWSWTSIANGTPPLRTSHAMAYDVARDRVVLHGGVGPGYWGPSPYEDTWEWSGSDWVLAASTGAGTRRDHAMAYDAARGRVVMFGGYDEAAGAYLGDTWEWDGAGWALVSTGGPAARSRHALAYRPAPGGGGRVVLFGGYDGVAHLSDTWEWDGSAWTPVLGPGPSARSGVAMALEEARGRVVLFGGYSGATDLGYLPVPADFPSDTWEWDGTAWSQVATAGPWGSEALAMAYDSVRGNVIVYGGNSLISGVTPPAGETDTTYAWVASHDHRPAVQFDASLAPFGVPLSRIDRVQVRAFAGGTFAPGGAGDVGVALHGWARRGPANEPGVWVPLPLASNAIGLPLPPGPASRVEWKSATAEEARSYVVEREGFSFQVRPSGGAGARPDGAAVALDYIEVRVRYLAP